MGIFKSFCDISQEWGHSWQEILCYNYPGFELDLLGSFTYNVTTSAFPIMCLCMCVSLPKYFRFIYNSV